MKLSSEIINNILNYYIIKTYPQKFVFKQKKLKKKKNVEKNLFVFKKLKINFKKIKN